jgi:hypothetical protein
MNSVGIQLFGEGSDSLVLRAWLVPLFKQKLTPTNPQPQPYRPEVRGARHLVRGPGCVALRPSTVWIGPSNPQRWLWYCWGHQTKALVLWL